MSDTVVWVYAVAKPPLRTSGLTGVAGEQVRSVSDGDLAAAVGSLSRDDYGESALRHNLEDLAWLDTQARRHHQVIMSLTELGPVVPMRLAVIYNDDDRVRQMLFEAQREIGAALAVVTGRSEWGVKAFVKAAEEVRGQSSAPPSSEATSQKAGMAYIQRKSAGYKAREEARTSHAATAEAVDSALRKFAVAARRHTPQDQQLTADPRDMLLNAAYLVQDEQAKEFTAAVAALSDSLEGVDIHLTGPWPAYSFTSTAGVS